MRSSSKAPDSVMPVVLLILKKSPELLSLMVAVPTAVTVPVLVAVKVNVSLLSNAVSLVIVVLTSKVVPVPFAPAGICTKSPAVYVCQADPS